MRQVTEEEKRKMSGGYMTFPNIITIEGVLPEDSEESDKETIKFMIDNYFNVNYPEFEPQIISTFDKQYYMPALKVLKLIDGEYYSPGYTAKWDNMELVAECKEQSIFNNYVANVRNGTFYFENAPSKQLHKAPDKDCNCGIYGSVNLDEIAGIVDINKHPEKYTMPISFTANMVLCIIEPSQDADVFICRKGWRSSHAFISEIVGETISTEESSQLLSMAWQRNINVGKIYENR